MRTRTGWTRLVVGAGLLVVAVALACGGLDLVEVSHDVDLPLPPELGGQPLVDELITAPEGFDPLQTPEMEKYGGTAAAIGEAFLQEATMEVTTGAANLDFLDSIQFFIKTANHPPVLLAEETSIPSGKQWISLHVDDGRDLTDLVGDGELIPEMVVSGTGPDQGAILNVAFTISLGISAESTCDAILGH